MTYPRNGCSLSTRRMSISRPPRLFVRASTVSTFSFSLSLNGKKHGRKLFRCQGQFHRTLIWCGRPDRSSCRSIVSACNCSNAAATSFEPSPASLSSPVFCTIVLEGAIVGGQRARKQRSISSKSTRTGTRHVDQIYLSWWLC